MNPTATATEKLKPSHHSSHTPPTTENGSDSITISVGQAAKIQVEQKKDDQECHGNDNSQPRLDTLQIFKLAAPGVIAGRKLYARCHGPLRIGDVAAEVAVADIDKDAVRPRFARRAANSRRTSAAQISLAKESAYQLGGRFPLIEVAIGGLKSRDRPTKAFQHQGLGDNGRP
jgi:hypothetical protein